MDINSRKYNDYLKILKEEMVPAMGCTEPIALAYAAAKCREVLEEPAEHCELKVSGPIIKNVKSVVVPNTGGRKGIKIAVSAGIVGGNASKMLEVISEISREQQVEASDYMDTHKIDIEPADNDLAFYIDITLFGKEHTARVVISRLHTNIILIERDKEIIWKKEEGVKGGYDTDHAILNVTDILDFANSVRLEDIRECIGRQVAYNTAISKEGLSGEWGAQIGKTLSASFGEDIRTRARAAASAGSDARMSGCELPVIIVSGSGNQGLTCSLPVIEYAKELGTDEGTLYRALVLSSLVTIHQKSGVGSVSAFCGAVCAGAGAGCGIAYLYGADIDIINHTIVNTLAICSGMLCDGAKPSCAAKISSAVDAGTLGYTMYKHHQQFRRGEGIVQNSVETTINAVGSIAREGMKQTDKSILDIMLND